MRETTLVKDVILSMFLLGGFKDGVGGAHVFGDIQLFGNGHQRSYDIFGTLGPPWLGNYAIRCTKSWGYFSQKFLRENDLPS